MSSYPQPNEHGTYSDEQAEVINYKSGKEEVILRVIQISADEWIQSCKIQYRNGGMSEPLSKDKCYKSRDDALLAALQRAESYSKTEAPKISKWAKEEISKLKKRLNLVGT